MKKTRLSRLSVFFIFLSAIVIGIVTSIIWGIFFKSITGKEIVMFNKHVYIRREINLEANQIKNAVNMINSERKRAYSVLRNTLKERNYNAYNTIKQIYNRYHSKLKKEQIKDMILDTLKFQVFDRGMGYYFITSLDGVEILGPQKNLIGKNLLKDKMYKQSIQQEINIVKNKGEGFVYGEFPINGKVEKRLAYVKFFKPFNWYVGTGRFITNFKKDTEKAILNKIKYAFSNYKNPALLIAKINNKGKCPQKIIFYTDPELSNYTCISSLKSKIKSLDGKPCIKKCLQELLKNGKLVTKIIWPFRKEKTQQEKIVTLYYYKPFNWVIGSYAPINFEAIFPNFKTILKQNVGFYIKNVFFISIIISVIIAALIWIIVFIQMIYKPVNKDIYTIIRFFKEYKRNSKIDLDKIKIKEIENIAENINLMFEEIEHKNLKIEELLNRFELLAENMPNCLGIFELNEKDEFVLSFTNSTAKTCPLVNEKMKNRRIEEIFKDIPNINKIIRTVFSKNHTVEFTTKCTSLGKTVTLTAYKLDSKSVVCIIRDISDTVNLFKQKDRTRKILETFLDKIKVGVIVLDRKANVRYINVFAKKLLGINDNGNLDINKLSIPNELKYRFAKVLHGKDICENCEINITTIDGKNRWFEVYTAQFNIEKEPLVIISFSDITQKYIKNKQLEYLSFHDSLTGLYNRRYFEEELKRLFKKRNYPLAMVLFDLNGLKIANDILGHETGDKLIIKTAEILLSSSRGSDIVSRIGGDEFAILMPNTDEKGVESLVNRIKEKVEENNQKNSLKISISYGFAIQYGEMEDPDELFKEADKSMYSNKYSKGRKRTLKDIIKWALSLKKEKIKTLRETGIDEDYFLHR